jgi:hypothetical protein
VSFKSKRALREHMGYGREICDRLKSERIVMKDLLHNGERHTLTVSRPLMNHLFELRNSKRENVSKGTIQWITPEYARTHVETEDDFREKGYADLLMGIMNEFIDCQKQAKRVEFGTGPGASESDKEAARRIAEKSGYGAKVKGEDNIFSRKSGN